MKKALALFTVLILLCAVCISFAGTEINKARDQVRFSETILYGDVSAIEGVTVRRLAQYDDHLLWDSVYRAGQEPSVTTDFTFSAEPFERDHVFRAKGVTLDNYAEHSVDFLEFENSMPDGREPRGLEVAYKELYDSAPANVEVSKYVYLRDYYEYYPINILLDLPGYSFYTYEMSWLYEDYWDKPEEEWPERLREGQRIQEAFENYFRIPVLEDHTTNITLRKDENGNIVMHGGGGSKDNTDAFNMYSDGIIAEKACYFAFDNRTNFGKIIDTSLIPGGYGIYRLPYHTEEIEPGSGRTGMETTPVIEVEKLETVYKLDPEMRFCNLDLSVDQSKLLLMTVENGMYVLTVIDADSAELLQRLEIAECSEEGGYYWGRYIYEDFTVLELSNNQLVLLTTNDSGLYDIEFVVKTQDLEPDKKLYYLNDEAVMDWNGKKLVIAGDVYDNYYYRENCGFYLAAYDDSGMLFYGEYASSLDDGTRYGSLYNYLCHPASDNALDVNWN